MKKYYTLHIGHDDMNENPRNEWDCLGTLYTWHRHYTLGGKEDENHQNPPDDYHIWIFQNFIADYNLRGALVNPQPSPFNPDFEKYMTDYDALYVDNGNDWEEPTAEEESVFRKLVNTWIVRNLCILPVYMYDHSGITISTGPFSCPWDSGQVGFIYVTREKCEKEGCDFAKADEILKSEIKILDQYLTGDVWCAEAQQLVGFGDFEFDEDHRVITNDTEAFEEQLEDAFIGGYEIIYSDDRCVVYLMERDPFGSGNMDFESVDCCGGIYGWDAAKDYLLHDALTIEKATA